MSNQSHPGVVAYGTLGILLFYFIGNYLPFALPLSRSSSTSWKP